MSASQVVSYEVGDAGEAADAIVSGAEALRALAETDPVAARASLGSRPNEAAELLHLAFDLGVLAGFASRAKTFLLQRARPWDSTGLARAADDPHIVRQWGEFSAKLQALTRLYEEAVAEADAPAGRRRAAGGSVVAVARSYAWLFATPLVNGVIEILGASATSDHYGFDLPWRELAAHAREFPPVADLTAIGRDLLVDARAGSARARRGAAGAAADYSANSSGAAALLQSPEQALQAARRVAVAWASSAAAIDAERRIPYGEVAELEHSGLLAITIPKEHGGPALSNVVLTRVFRILAATDVALAQIPQNHFDFVDTLTSAAPATQRVFYDEVLRGRRFGNAIAERGRRSRRDLATTIVERDGGYVINGVKAFCTGALTAAWVPVLAKHPDGRILTAYVERTTPGLDVKQDWDAFGQRATFSGTTVLTEVFVPRERVVDRGRGHPALLLAQFAGNQLIHAAIEVGAAEGALAQAAELILAHDDPPSAGDLERLGAWRTQAEAARALVDHAAELVDRALAAREPSRDLAVAALIAVDESKSVAYALGPAVTGDLIRYEAAAQTGDGLDRLWRNSRTHSLHDPVRWRQFYVGNYHLNGELAPDIAQRFEPAATTV
jgi:alkylation response protein AidB-like acyl-CoA dehydrogenase